MTTDAAPPLRASRYTTGAIVLHWTIALLIVVQLAGGYAMSDILADGSPTQFDVFQLHKSFGVTVLILTIARILWRLFNPPPSEHASVGRLEALLAHTVHFLFYALLLAVPLAGWVLITVSPIQLQTVLFFADWLPFPNLPGLGGLPEATRDVIAERSEAVHGFLAYSMLALLGLHVAGALKHQWTHGGFLQRMTFGGRGDGPRRAFGLVPTLAVTLAVFGALVGSAALVRSGGDTATATSPGAAPAATPADAGAAPQWTVIAEESSLGYAFDLDNASIAGQLPDFTATVRFDEANLGGSAIEAELSLDSVTLEGRGVSLSQLKGADGLAVAAQPLARFASEEITAAEGGGFLARGTLSVRGVEAAIDLPFTLERRPDGLVLAKASAALDRTTFGFGEDASRGGINFSPTVTVSIEILARPPDER